MVLELDIIIRVGPDVQAQGFGWSLGSWGGQEVGAFSQLFYLQVLQLCNKYNIKRCITVSNIRNKLYTNRNRRNILHRYITNTLTGVTRGVRNTTAASHSGGATVTSSSDFVAWGEAASGDLVIDPGMWSLITLVTKLFV